MKKFKVKFTARNKASIFNLIIKLGATRFPAGHKGVTIGSGYLYFHGRNILITASELKANNFTPEDWVKYPAISNMRLFYLVFILWLTSDRHSTTANQPT